MIEKFILLHIKHFNVVSYEAVRNCIDNQKHVFIRNCILITYFELRDRYHISLLLYDVNQDDNRRKSLVAFKRFMKKFDKPVYINNVIPRFEHMCTHVKGKTYRWNV